MCGAYTVVIDERGKKRLHLRGGAPEVRIHKTAPTLPLPIITQEAPDTLTMMRWGLVPPYVKDLKDFRYTTFNARAEEVESSRIYAKPLQHHRCLIPANGFFEWLHYKSQKIPYYIERKDKEYILFAGVWEHNPILKLDSFTMLTTEANRILGEIHDKKRMPVILTEEEAELWLSPDLQEKEAHALMDPFPDKELHAYTVSQEVNHRGAEGPQLLEPFTYEIRAIKPEID